MSSRIHVLPAALADQIAAGEVVERPASVVKELVENALDAGARRVEIEIERGGLDLIRVSDDGEGMSPDDAHLALRRHATSKLRSAEDLFRLGSFGFRGEALPSIASISRLVLTTRRAEATAGHRLAVEAGVPGEATEIGAPPGTRVEVHALFGNVPARLKFQKSIAIEAGHVLDAITRISLGEPGVHLRLRVDGRVVIDLPPHPSLGERAIAILRRTAPGTRLAFARHAEGAIVAEVHLAPPEVAVQSARRVHLLVNRRAVRDRGLLAAVQVGFGELLPRGKHPLAVISVAIPSADVDVNVHPQKLEVRLARAAEVHAAVRHAVAQAVRDAGFVVPRSDEVGYAMVSDDPLVADDADDQALERGAERGRAYELVRALAGDAADPGDDEPPAPTAAAAAFLGALPGGYLIFRDAAGLVVLDQHAASALLIGAAAARDPRDEDEAWQQRVADDAARPTAIIAEPEARALLDGLRALVEAGRWATIEEALWRGRRAAMRVPLSELWRRLEA